MSFTDNDLDFYIKTERNVLIRGPKGVGKTHKILQAFKRAGLNYLYFSAATMDPWVDFIGVPKEATDEDGNTYLDLVRPKQFAKDEVQAIFLDEFNRAPKKVRNAVMELLQFKSINGFKFNNLKIIWTAVNPKEEGEEQYDVEDLDPAQADRFEIQLTVPYTLNIPYFTEKYGKDTALTASNWWNGLNEKQRQEVSPRRLDYALSVWSDGGKLEHVLTSTSDPKKLSKMLSQKSLFETIEKFVTEGKLEALKGVLSDPNNVAFVKSFILSNKDLKVKYTGIYCMPYETQHSIVSGMSNTQYTEFLKVLENLPLDKEIQNIVYYTKDKNLDLTTKLLDQQGYIPPAILKPVLTPCRGDDLQSTNSRRAYLGILNDNFNTLIPSSETLDHWDLKTAVPLNEELSSICEFLVHYLVVARRSHAGTVKGVLGTDKTIRLRRVQDLFKPKAKYAATLISDLNIKKEMYYSAKGKYYNFFPYTIDAAYFWRSDWKV